MSLAMTSAQIAEYLGGKLVGRGDLMIRGVAKIEEAGPDDLSFVANARYVKYLKTSRAGVVLISSDLKVPDRTVVIVADPYLDFLRLLERFYTPAPWLASGVHPTAVIEPSASLSSEVTVGAYAYVGPRAVIGAGSVIYPHAVIAADVVIGEQCEIHSHVSLRERVRLGRRVIVHDGTVIGSDGFGFAPTPDGYRKIPQCGTVVIGDDVEIGANTTIDRATLGETVVGRGTKLDNLVQIAHNVSVGVNTVVAAQTGISGSTKVGDGCRIAGQAGLVGHLNIGDRVAIGAQSGIANDVDEGQTVSGSPARPHMLWKRIQVSLTRLPGLIRRVGELEAAVFGNKKSENKS